ncbi:Carbohydrate binding module (family 6) [Streptomyces sp. 1222.5]|uniref:alpha-galactosidase D n=1 Tax=unclassified Streptomyces TaxID=2593676 RepID=UPI00089C0537|nr:MULTISPECIES: carbohydrate-binding protein [unclassified Streptomyces]PKW05873.1 carbohydrate binding protein with CBM6 domain [Streptomyces sp. 5112.2]SED26430.1 Carbohydrate binding module (family 6) [Streptomyces sp. 1222.5]
MRSPSHSVPPARALGAAVVLALTAGLATTAPATAHARTARADTASAGSASAVAARPFMGWSSWSMQSSKYPGLNPDGDYSYLTEANVLKQADALAARLKRFGYEYVNIDSGWWRDKDWKPGFDAHARQQADPVRFPHGMKAVADHIHRLGLKAGIYLPVGLEKEAYGDGTVPLWHGDGCTTADIVYGDLRTTNGWDSAYKIDFGRPCAQKYIDSQARAIASWGYDFLKLDGVGPGSFKSGDNYDNVADVAAWQKAIAATGRPVHLELSWSLDIGHAADWKKYAGGWRVDTDVECYCNTLVGWENSVDDRFDDTPGWTRHAGPGGWNDLDSLDVGNGAMDGLTKAERQTYATLWAIAKSPLYTGDDLTKLDDYGVRLLTNREVIAVDQGDGPPARPVTPSDPQQVWAAKNPDGTHTVALFNLADAPAAVTADFSSLGFTGNAAVRDLWNHEDLGSRRNRITEALPAHGSRLFTVTPHGSALRSTGYEAEAGGNTLGGKASVADCSACSGGKKVGDLYLGGTLRFNDVVVDRPGTYLIEVTYISGDPRPVNVSAGSGAAIRHRFPSTGDWGTPETVSVPVTLKAGANTVTFDSGSDYAPDIDRIDVPSSPRQ